MVLTRCRQHTIALVSLGLFIVMIAWHGFDIAWLGAIAVIGLSFGFAYPVYLVVIAHRAARRPVTLETGRLVQRDRNLAAVATIDLTAPFASEYVAGDVGHGEYVLYKVRQGRTVMWVSVPGDGDGALVRAIGLSWPPRLRSGAGYL